MSAAPPRRRRIGAARQRERGGAPGRAPVAQPFGGRSALERLWIPALVALGTIAAAWRWAYLARLRHTPFADSLDADAGIYWSWSDFILRHGLWPPSPLFLAPLYPYVLAAWRSIGSGSIAQVLAIQAVLGAFAVALLADAASRVAGRRAALVVGAMLLAARTATFFDGLILPESLLFFVESVLVWFVARTDWSRAGTGRFAVYGALVGVLAQGRASNAVLLGLILLLARAGPRSLPRRLAGPAVACGVFALSCVPALVVNHRASGEWIPFTYNLGFNLYVGNNPEAQGGYVDVTRGSNPVPLEGALPTTGGALDGRAFLLATRGVRLSPAASSANWAQQAESFVRAAPGKAFRLAGRKLLLAWNARELPQIESMASFARAAGPLGLPIAGSFALLAILGLAGIPSAARGDATRRWLVGYVAALTVMLVPFFVTDRYRHHLEPALAALAGIALVELAHAVRRGSAGARARTAAVLALAASVVFAPVRPQQAGSRAWTFAVDRGIRLIERGAYAEAADQFARAERSLGSVRPQALTPGARVDLAAFYHYYGTALEALGRSPEAVERWERAAALDPNNAITLGRLALAYERAGSTADAARVRRMLERVPGGGGQLLVDDGWTDARRGDLASAEERFLEAVRAVPNLSVAWEGLIRVRIQTGRFTEARQALEQARGAGLEPSPAAIYEAYLDLQGGDPAGARRALQRLPRGFVSSDPVLVRLLEYSRNALRR